MNAALKTYLCIKIFLVLLFWSMVFIYIQKVYNDNNPYVDRNNQIIRAKKITNFLKKHNVLSDQMKNSTKIGELLTDNSGVPNIARISKEIELELPSIPIHYWGHKPMQNSSNCTKFPSLMSLQYHNKYWQIASIKNSKLYLYNAYYDTRKDLKGGRPVVRVLAMTDNVFIKPYCQIWYKETSEPIITKASSFDIWFSRVRKTPPWLSPKSFTCPTTGANKNATTFRIPKVVSLVANKCDRATNALRIHYDEPNVKVKQKFAVCIKGMSFLHDISTRLVEWIELQLLLGASKIFLYHLSLHPNVIKVLDYYVQRGIVDYRSTTLADINASSRFTQYFLLSKQKAKKTSNEQIVYNDCFYRNLYRYEYVSVQDLDEVLMPVGNYSNWAEIMAVATNRKNSTNCQNGYSSYCFRHFHFSNWISPNNTDPRIPQFMHMLQHVERQNERKHVPRYNTKCFHRTERTVMMHNHISWKWLGDVCPTLYFNATTVAKLHHYRNSNFGKNTTPDFSVRRFQDELVKRSLLALQEIGLLKTNT